MLREVGESLKFLIISVRNSFSPSRIVGRGEVVRRLPRIFSALLSYCLVLSFLRFSLGRSSRNTLGKIILAEEGY